MTIRKSELSLSVQRAIIKRQLQDARDLKVQRLTLKPEDEPAPLTRWQRVRAVIAKHWTIARQHLGRTNRA